MHAAHSKPAPDSSASDCHSNQGALESDWRERILSPSMRDALCDFILNFYEEWKEQSATSELVERDN